MSGISTILGLGPFRPAAGPLPLPEKVRPECFNADTMTAYSLDNRSEPLRISFDPSVDKPAGNKKINRLAADAFLPVRSNKSAFMPGGRAMVLRVSDAGVE